MSTDLDDVVRIDFTPGKMHPSDISLANLYLLCSTSMPCSGEMLQTSSKRRIIYSVSPWGMRLDRHAWVAAIAPPSSH